MRMYSVLYCVVYSCHLTANLPQLDLSAEGPEVAIFRQKNATKYGYFPANLQKFWAIFRQIAEVWAIPIWHFFWNFLPTYGEPIWQLCI